jgi:flagellar L-ring protein precursor FlgH
MRKAALILTCALTSALALSGCASVGADVKETLGTPKQAPMGFPAALVPMNQAVLNPEPEQGAASPNSLWRAGARTFFHDQRARRVGDILTVEISIADSAQVSNETNRSRASTANAGVPHLFGLESTLGKILPSSNNGANLIGLSSADASDGKGVITRSETINLTVAAVVTGVLPNGNLIIQGRQEVTTNNDLRELTVSGIVRPEDISSSNTIKHTQIAEARISYAGRGDIARVQKTPAGQSLIEKFSPF